MLRITMEWNKRKSTRCVWTTLVMTTFALCILFVFIILNLGTNYNLIDQGSPDRLPLSEKLTEEECIPVCDSEICIQQSKLLLDHLQPASNPCDNFNKFSCGTFTGTFPDRGGAWVIRLNKQLRIKLRNILENIEASSDSSSDKMKMVYDSCIKPDSDTEAVPTLLQILEKFGIKDWPYLTSDFEFGNITLAKVIANILLHKEYGFVALSRVDSPGDKFLQVGSKELGEFMPVPSSEAMKLQRERILKYLNLNSETIAKILEEREAIHREIENLILESEEIASASMYEDLNVNCSGENEWTDLCGVVNLFLDIAKVNEEVSSEQVKIGSGDIHYMRNIFPLLRNFSDRAVANYLAMDVFLNHLNELNLYFRLAHDDVVDEGLKLFDMASPVERWQLCVDSISSGMSYALMYEYGKKEFTIDMFNELTNMTDELIHDVADYYSLQEWLPESVRNEKAEEIRKYEFKSPSEKDYPSDNTVNEFYDGFKPKSKNFLNNVMELRRFKTVEKLRGIIDSEMLEKKIFKADAFGGGGHIVIGLTLLQPPYFITGQRISNLVSLGFTIVHEIGHSLFDRRDFLTPYFGGMMQCLTNQVSQYQFELIGKNLNGRQYLHEDIADNVAVSITDKIIERYLTEGVESILPGLPFSTKQLMYIEGALLFCSASYKRKQELYSQGSHSPDDVRIYQRAKNSRIFPEAFDCPVGSAMNPADKCNILTEGRSE